MELALCLRTHFFFENLLADSKTYQEKKAIEQSRLSFYKGEFAIESLLLYFDKEVLRNSLRMSTDRCVGHAKTRCSKDENLDPCSVCLENGANYYIFHGGTAHKCVCAPCAMKIAIKDNPKCPICREGVSFMADSAPRRSKCDCGKPECSTLVLMNVKQIQMRGKVFDRCKATAECTSCTLEKEAMSVVGVHMVYKLFR